MNRRALPMLLAAALLAPVSASAAVSIEAFYGFTRPPSADFTSAVSGAADDPDLIDNSLNIAGGDIILHLGLLELGAIIDTSWRSGSASQTAIGALVGVGGDVGGNLRLELLGEVGGQRYGNFAENTDVVTASSSEEWLAYVGVRPGVAYRFPMGDLGVLVGVWGFARWDLSTSDVPLTVGAADDTSAGSVELGGTSIGAVLRFGLDF